MRVSVVLPQPDGPVSTTHSPWRTTRFTPDTDAAPRACAPEPPHDATRAASAAPAALPVRAAVRHPAAPRACAVGFPVQRGVGEARVAKLDRRRAHASHQPIRTPSRNAATAENAASMSQSIARSRRS